MGRWLWRQSAGAAALASLAALSLWLLGIATDEGGVSWSLRWARLSTLVPLAAAIGFGGMVWRVERRGEALVWESLGVAPWRWLLPMALSALWPVWSACACVAFGAWPVADTGLFPASAREPLCVFEHGAFVCEPLGLAVRDGQLLEHARSGAAIATGLPAQGASALLLALMSAALLWLCVRPLRAQRGWWAPWLFGGVQLLMCQAVGARKAPWLVAAALPVLIMLALFGAAWGRSRAVYTQTAPRGR